jgi:hypothetical protein
MNCPRCASTDFSYGDKLALMPRRFGSSTRFCKNCGNILVATSKSVILFFAYMIAMAYLVSEIFIKIGVQDIEAASFAVALIVLPLSYLVIWPLVLEVKIYRYQASFRKSVWLPKSRIVGYTVYLVFPIMIIVLLMYWGARDIGTGITRPYDLQIRKTYNE